MNTQYADANRLKQNNYARENPRTDTFINVTRPECYLMTVNTHLLRNAAATFTFRGEMWAYE